MRIGVITDIHNNVVALNAVLEKFHTEGCEQVICCGDIIGIGPYPEETVQRIMQGINNEVCYNILYKIIQTNLDLNTSFILEILQFLLFRLVKYQVSKKCY